MAPFHYPFPSDFMFSLTREEIMNLSQIVISSRIKQAPTEPKKRKIGFEVRESRARYGTSGRKMKK